MVIELTIEAAAIFQGLWRGPQNCENSQGLYTFFAFLPVPLSPDHHLSRSFLFFSFFFHFFIFCCLFLACQGEFTKKKASLKHTLEDLFGRAVSFDVKPAQQRVTLRVLKKLSGTEMPKHLSSSVSLSQILEALDITGQLLPKLELLAKNLDEHFVRPLLTNPQLAVSSSETGIIAELVCAPVSGKKDSSQQQQQQQQQSESSVGAVISGAVFEKLLCLFRFLDLKLLRSGSGDHRMEEGEDTGSYFAHLLGSAWWKELSGLIINEALEKSLPTDYAQLEKYPSFGEMVIKFENELIGIGMISFSFSLSLNNLMIL